MVYMEHTNSKILETSKISGMHKVYRCIHDAVEEECSKHPLRPAVSAHDGRFSYAELSSFSNKISQQLVTRGARAEERAIILMEKSALYPVTALAVLKSGAAFVPLDPTHPIRRLKELVKEIQPFIIISSALSSKVAYDLGENILLVDALSEQSVAAPTRSLGSTPKNTAYIVFTSGSTGKPKGVVVEHSAFITSSLARGRIVDLGQHSRVLQYAAHTFDVSIDEIFSTLIHGGCVCIPSEEERFAIAPAIARMNVNHVLLTPTSAKTINPEDVPGLQTMQLGGELLTEDVNDKWSSRVRLFNVYGPTEASVACIVSERTGQKGIGHVIGRAVGSICYVVDTEDHNKLLPPDTVGELVVGGPILARGYFNDNIKTETSFISYPSWAAHAQLRIYKTGDIVSMDGEGLMTIHGRQDNQIKCRGQRINVEEIENALCNHPKVERAIVWSPKKGPLEDKLTAILSLRSATSGDATLKSAQASFSDAQPLLEPVQSELYHELQNLLPPAMVPSKWIQLPYLPQTSSSKTDRKQLREWIESMNETQLRYIFAIPAKAASESDRKCTKEDKEITMCQIWAQVLSMPPSQVRADKSFIGNGGDSISAMELRRIASQSGISLMVSDILSAENVRQLLQCSTSPIKTNPVFVKEVAGALFALSPVQEFYLENMGDGDDGFCQSVALELKNHLSKETLAYAVSTIIDRHAMLRARFLKKDNRWFQSISEHSKEPENMLTSSTGAFNEDSWMASNTFGIHIKSGPVFRAHLLETYDERQILQLTGQHLVLDFVSWRVILQDLNNIIKGNTLTEPTLSFQSWCSLQTDHAKTLNIKANLPFDCVPDNLSFWSPKGGQIKNVWGETDATHFRLTATDTKALLGPCNEVLETRPVEVMLACFNLAFGEIFPERENPNVFIESHGREPWRPEIDISRTVGWFTTAYPLHVPRVSTRNLVSAVDCTRQRKRSVHDNGYAFWTNRYLNANEQRKYSRGTVMEFVFNFAGQVQQLDAEDCAFHLRSKLGEETAHPSASRLSLFDILITVVDNQLHFTLTFPNSLQHRDRVIEFTQAWRSWLESIARDWSEPNSQIPLIVNSPPDLQQMMHRGGFDGPNQIAGFFWPSHLQQQMLQSHRRNPLYYQVTGTWTLLNSATDNSIDLYRLRRAWHQVVNLHPNLRTVFLFSDIQDRFLGLVLKSVDPEIFEMEEADVPKKSRPPTLGTEAPGHLMCIVLMKDGSLTCRLEFNHVIMDATSRTFLLEELIQAYDGKLVISGERSPPERFAEMEKPLSQTTVSIPRCVFPTTSMAQGTKEDISAVAFTLSIPAIDILSTCADFEITFSNYVFTAWSILLSKYVGMKNVSFAYVLAKRSTNPVAAKRAVGCYVDLLVSSIDLAQYNRILDVARAIQKQCSDHMSSDTRAAEAARYLDNGHDSGMFNTMVNVRTTTGFKGQHVKDGGLEFRLENFYDPWDYDLVLSVDRNLDSTMLFTINYRTNKVSREVAAAVACDFESIIEIMAVGENSSRPLCDLMWMM